VDAAHGADARDAVGNGGDRLVPITVRRVRDDEQGRGDTLQDLDLSNDDGAPFDDEVALVLTAEPTGTSARHDGGSRRRCAHEPIMTEVHIGRLVGASLHQAIGEWLPQRLDFYENWLHSEGLRDGSIGVAPLMAVLGFLRTEGDGYGRVVERAGQLSAEWSLMSLSPMRQRIIRLLPRRLRVRAALRVAAEISETAGSRSRFIVEGRGKSARVK